MTEQLQAGVVVYAKDLDRVTAFYSTVLGLPVVGRDDEHVVLEAAGFQLVVLRIPTDVASAIIIATPPVRRALAAIKPVFFVPSINRVRVAAELCGGVMNDSDREWAFQGFTVCDGLDPEGNVIQFRQRVR
jgi:catechol 2,3-dioxygenase-like lactoylglutathione lyase family enzyme